MNISKEGLITNIDFDSNRYSSSTENTSLGNYAFGLNNTKYMHADLAESSMKKNPIIKLTVCGEEDIEIPNNWKTYEIEIKSIDPKNASAFEMLHQMNVFSSENTDDFMNKKINWVDTVVKAGEQYEESKEQIIKKGDISTELEAYIQKCMNYFTDLLKEWDRIDSKKSSEASKEIK